MPNQQAAAQPYNYNYPEPTDQMSSIAETIANLIKQQEASQDPSIYTNRLQKAAQELTALNPYGGTALGENIASAGVDIQAAQQAESDKLMQAIMSGQVQYEQLSMSQKQQVQDAALRQQELQQQQQQYEASLALQQQQVDQAAAWQKWQQDQAAWQKQQQDQWNDWAWQHRDDNNAANIKQNAGFGGGITQLGTTWGNAQGGGQQQQAGQKPVSSWTLPSVNIGAAIGSGIGHVSQQPTTGLTGGSTGAMPSANDFINQFQGDAANPVAGQVGGSVGNMFGGW